MQALQPQQLTTCRSSKSCSRDVGLHLEFGTSSTIVHVLTPLRARLSTVSLHQPASEGPAVLVDVYGFVHDSVYIFEVSSAVLKVAEVEFKIFRHRK
jgi:hypothetical protein